MIVFILIKATPVASAITITVIRSTAQSHGSHMLPLTPESKPQTLPTQALGAAREGVPAHRDIDL